VGESAGKKTAPVVKRVVFGDPWKKNRWTGFERVSRRMKGPSGNSGKQTSTKEKSDPLTRREERSLDTERKRIWEGKKWGSIEKSNPKKDARLKKPRGL